MSPKQLLHGAVVGGVCLMPFVVLVVTHSTFFPFIFGKNVAFRVLVEVLFVLWGALMVLDAQYRPRLSTVLVAVATFVGVIAIADMLGANPAKSIWSNYERMEGLVTLVHLGIYVLIAGSVFVKEQVGLWFWRISIAVAGFVSLYAVAQALLTDTFRLDATLGNPIYLAVYALFHIFMAGVLALRPQISTLERWLLLATLPLQIWVLVMTATRGATIGLVLGACVAGVGILFSQKDNVHIRRITIGVLMLVVVLVSLLVAFRQSDFVQESRVLKRFVTISFTEGTVFARTVVWSMAWEGVKERPLLGWGQENFSLVFNKHYDPRMYAQEPWFDRTHNAVFDWLIAGGVLGLLSYLSLFLSLLWVLYKTTALTQTQKWILVGLLVAYGFHNLTVFDQIISYILFFSLIAWLYAHDVRDVVHKRQGITFSVPAQWVLVGGAFVGGLFLAWALNIQAVFTNLLFIEGLRDASRATQAQQEGQFLEARGHASSALLSLTEAGLSGGYGTQEIREHTAQVASRFGSAQWMPSQEKDLWLGTAEEGLRKEEAKAPGEARFPVFLGALYTAFGEHEKARVALERAHALSPKKQSILVELAANALLLGNEAEARTYIQEAYELETSYTTPAVLYAIRLIAEKDFDTFDAEFGEAVYLGRDVRVLATLVRTQEYERAHALWERAFEASHNPAEAFLLARIYAQVGDTKRAIATLRRVIAIDPRATQEAEQIIESLK